MSEIAQTEFEQTGEFLRALLETFNKWLRAVGNMIEQHGRTKAERELGRLIGRDGAYIYHVKGHCGEQLRRRLMDVGIATIQDVDNPDVLIVAQAHVDRIKDMNREILVARGNYYQEVDTVEMEDAIARHDRIADKEIFTLKDLTETEYTVLKNKCNNIDYGFMIGVKPNEAGNYDVSVHGSRVLSKNGANDFCRAYLASTISLYGANSNIKIQQLAADKKFDEMLASLKGGDNSYYIVSAENKNMYIELTSEGFEFYERRLKNGEMVDGITHKSDITDVDYEAELQVCLDMLQDKVLLKSNEELVKYFNGDKFQTQRPLKGKKQRSISYVEHKTVDTIDNLIKTKIADEKLSFDNAADEFSYYCKEADSILSDVIQRTAKSGYAEHELQGITELFDSKKIDVSQYSKPKEYLGKNECEVHEAHKAQKTTIREVQEQHGDTDR